jgi:hypothetical protein
MRMIIMIMMIMMMMECRSESPRECRALEFACPFQCRRSLSICIPRLCNSSHRCLVWSVPSTLPLDRVSCPVEFRSEKCIRTKCFSKPDMDWRRDERSTEICVSTHRRFIGHLGNARSLFLAHRITTSRATHGFTIFTWTMKKCFRSWMSPILSRVSILAWHHLIASGEPWSSLCKSWQHLAGWHWPKMYVPSFSSIVQPEQSLELTHENQHMSLRAIPSRSIRINLLLLF